VANKQILNLGLRPLAGDFQFYARVDQMQRTKVGVQGNEKLPGTYNVFISPPDHFPWNSTLVS
jgi:hypothetical protein